MKLRLLNSDPTEDNGNCVSIEWNRDHVSIEWNSDCFATEQNIGCENCFGIDRVIGAKHNSVFEFVE